MIDWRTIVVKLVRLYGSQRKLAPHVGMGYRAIANLCAGESQSPRFENGIRLLALYSERIEHIPGAAELAERVK